MAWVARGALTAAALLAASAGCGPQRSRAARAARAARAVDGGSAAEPAWQVVYDGTALGGALLSVWGSGPGRGVRRGRRRSATPASSAVAWRFDGTSWKDLAPGGADSFWWVSGTGSDRRVDGRREGADDALGRRERSTEYPARDHRDDLGSCGPRARRTRGRRRARRARAPPPRTTLILHWDGAAWSKVHAARRNPSGARSTRVWGTSSDDLYAVGEFATVWHKKGAEWLLESDPPVAKSHACSPCSGAARATSTPSAGAT
jgi:hypothetical protein